MIVSMSCSADISRSTWRCTWQQVRDMWRLTEPRVESAGLKTQCLLYLVLICDVELDLVVNLALFALVIHLVSQTFQGECFQGHPCRDGTVYVKSENVTQLQHLRDVMPAGSTSRTAA